MNSFDVKNLFTNVPLEETIDNILNKIYDEKKIKTNIPGNSINDLLYLCTNHVDFTYGGKNVYSNRWSSHGILVRPTIGKHIYDISRSSHITIH